MKFWKHTLFTIIGFFAVATTVTYTSCVEDPCLDLRCQNGGTCVNGYCNCPSGWEGGFCETKSIDKYAGHFYGYTKVDERPVIVDSAIVTSIGIDALQAMAYSEGDSIKGTVTDLNGDQQQLIGTPISQGSYGSTTITIEKNKLVLYVEKYVNGKKTVYTFTGNK